MSEVTSGIRLTADAQGVVGGSAQSADALKSVEEQAKRTAASFAEMARASATSMVEARRQADEQRRQLDEQRRVNDEMRRAIDAQNQARIADAARKFEASGLATQLLAQREAQTALNVETERGSGAMRSATADAIAMTAAKHGLRGAMTGVIGLFTGAGGLISLLAAGAVSWSTFGASAEEASKRAEAAAKKASEAVKSIYIEEGIARMEERRVRDMMPSLGDTARLFSRGPGSPGSVGLGLPAAPIGLLPRGESDLDRDRRELGKEIAAQERERAKQNDAAARASAAEARRDAAEMARAEAEALREGAAAAKAEGAAVEANLAVVQRASAGKAVLIAQYAAEREALDLEASLIYASAAEREKAIAIRRIEVQARSASAVATAEEIVKIDELAAAQKRLVSEFYDDKAARERATAAAESARRAAQESAQEWKRASDSIERSLSDALMRGFDKGKSWGQNAADALKNMFKTLILEPIIRPVAQAGASLVTGAMQGIGNSIFGGGGASGGGLSMNSLLSLGSNAYSAISGNSIMGSLGGLFGGSSLAASSAAGIGAAGIAGGLSAGLGGAGAAAVGVGAAGVAGGATAAAAVPYVGWAIAAIALASSLMGKGGGPKDSEAVLGYDQYQGIFGLGDNNAPGAAGPFAALAAEFSDPSKYDPKVLADLIGPPNARKSFWAGPGDINSLLQQVRQFAAPAAAAAQQRNASLVQQLQNSGVLGQSLQGYIDSQQVSEYLSPEDRLAGAQSLFDSAIARAGQGDAAAAQNLPGLANTLLGAGRGVYASGEKFQSLRGEINSQLARVLDENARSQEKLLADMPTAIREQTAELVAQFKAMTAELKSGLEKLNQGLRLMEPA